eukprot:TRINITY_DN4204_c0_g2_i1.p1 TRINITY_DN4204_c0_g2~~TRINITY_DN4204_c0_g2_i1.p1  ORF type:complete len:106 (-),score=3.22 TRINITY_DN4204_c0_g2_i1:360-677(-)
MTFCAHCWSLRVPPAKAELLRQIASDAVFCDGFRWAFSSSSAQPSSTPADIALHASADLLAQALPSKSGHPKICDCRNTALRNSGLASAPAARSVQREAPRKTLI